MPPPTGDFTNKEKKETGSNCSLTSFHEGDDDNKADMTDAEQPEPDVGDSVTDDRVNLITESSTSDNNVVIYTGSSSDSHLIHVCCSSGKHAKSRSVKLTDETPIVSDSNQFQDKGGPPENQSNESVPGGSHRGSSDSSITCRICQLSETESGEPVKTADCRCKGYLDAIHRSCLLEWIRYKGTKICEVCASEFSDVPSPSHTPPDETRQQELETLFRQYARLRPLTRKKRACVGSLVVFLTIVSAIAGVLTVSTDRQFRNVSSNPWSTIKSINETYIMFSVCLSFLLFCTALTFGTLLTWCTLEVTYHYQRQRVWQRAVRLASSNQNAV